MNIAVVSESDVFQGQAEALANRLHAPLLNQFFFQNDWRSIRKKLKEDESTFEFLLCCGSHGLSLLNLVSENPVSPVYIDFSDTSWKRRLFNISSKKELAAKALGFSSKRKTSEHRILDANAGLGQDLFVFAALGGQIHGIERSGVVFELLRDALERAGKIPELQSIVERIELVQGDSINMLSRQSLEDVDAIYLDPMFPEKRHASLAKKEMQLFQAFLGADEDAETLVKLSLDYLYGQNSCSRVVLKRPRLAPVLFEEQLGRQVFGNATRFDIYFSS